MHLDEKLVESLETLEIEPPTRGEIAARFDVVGHHEQFEKGSRRPTTRVVIRHGEENLLVADPQFHFQRPRPGHAVPEPRVEIPFGTRWPQKLGHGSPIELFGAVMKKTGLGQRARRNRNPVTASQTLRRTVAIETVSKPSRREPWPEPGEPSSSLGKAGRGSSRDHGPKSIARVYGGRKDRSVAQKTHDEPIFCRWVRRMNTRKSDRRSLWKCLGLALGLSLPTMAHATLLEGSTGKEAGSISDALDRYVQRLAERPTAHRPAPKAPEAVEENRDPQLLLALNDQLDRHLPGRAAALRPRVEGLARESIRIGFGLPLTLTKKLLRGSRPLASLLAGGARSLREAGQGCSVMRLHRVVEKLLGQVQNTNWLFARTVEELDRAASKVVEARRSVAVLTNEAPDLRYALSALTEAQRKGEDNLVLARDAVRNGKELVGRVFRRMTGVMAFLDEISSKAWSSAPEQITLARHPQGLERCADAFMTSLRELRSLGRDNHTTRDLFKTHYKALVGIFQTYARAPHATTASPSIATKEGLKDASLKLQKIASALSSYMASSRVELAKLDAWLGDLVAMRSPELELEALPDWLLGDVSGQRRPLIPRSDPSLMARAHEREGVKAGAGRMNEASFRSALDLVEELASDGRRLDRPALASPLSDLLSERDRGGHFEEID